MRRGDHLKFNNRGFSLVELIIVIAMMAVLVGILAPQFVKYIEQSRESKDLKTMEEIKKAVEAYAADHEHKGDHVVEADGTTITYTLGDGGSLEPYGIETATFQSSSDKIVAKWVYSDYTWSVNDSCGSSGAYYDAYGNRI